MKKNIKLICLLLIATSAVSCSPSRSSISSSSTSSSTLSTDLTPVKPEAEYENKTNILAYKANDSIAQDYQNRMSIYNIAAKSLTSRNHREQKWRQDIKLTVAELPFYSRQETSYLGENIAYQESSLMAMGVNFGRTVNAYRGEKGFVFGHAKSRTSNICLFSTSMCDADINVPTADLAPVTQAYIEHDIGDFTAVEDLFPINSFTIDEEKSEMKKVNDYYILTLHADNFSIFSNLLKRFGLENTDFITYLDATYNTNPDLLLTYTITDDYHLQNIAYNWNSNEVSFSSEVAIENIATIANQDSYDTVSQQNIISDDGNPLADFQESTFNLFKNIFIQLTNASQFTVPLALKMQKDDDNYLTLTGTIEFQTSWTLNDFASLDFDDRDQILQTFIDHLSFNIVADSVKVASGHSHSAQFLTSYNCQTKNGQFTLKFDDGQVKTQDYDLFKIHSFSDIASLLSGFIATNFPDLSLERPSFDWKTLCKNLRGLYDSQIEAPNFDGTLNFIDPYFAQDLLKGQQLEVVKDGNRVTSVTFNSAEDSVTRISEFLNGNDLTIIYREIAAIISATENQHLRKIAFNLTDLNFKFELRQNTETLLLDALKISFSATFGEKSEVAVLTIGELREMNSQSEFILDKYRSAV